MKRKINPSIVRLLSSLTLLGFLGGCCCFSGGPKARRFTRPADSVVEQMKIISRTPIQFSEVPIDEVTAKMIADETEAALSPAIKQIRGKVQSPDRFAAAEQKYGAEGYFDSKTGQFSWAKFKTVLDAVGSTAHLEINYVLGKGMVQTTSANTTTTYSVPSLELSAVLYSCETGTILWQSKHPIANLMQAGMFSGITGNLNNLEVKTLWKKQHNVFKNTWKIMAQELCELTLDKKCMKVKK